MKIIICDDQRDELQALKNLISLYAKTQSSSNWIILPYASSKTLDFDLEDKARADLYILDIDMPSPNGIDLALKIRSLYPYALVYFYTSHSEYWQEGYRADVRRYILKNAPSEQLYEALHYASSKCRQLQEDTISFERYNDVLNLPKSDILYVTRENRQLAVHTLSDGIIYDRRGIQSLYLALQAPYLLWIDRGSFINVMYVHKTEENRVIMANGDVMTISRSRVLQVKRAILNHWNGDENK